MGSAGKRTGDSTPAIGPTVSNSAGYLDGRLLIAMPVMGDPRFERSVIYLCAHSAEGAMGIIVNHPAGSIDFPELLEQLGIIKKGAQIKLPENAESMKVLRGGPVDTGRGFVMCIRDRGQLETEIQSNGWLHCDADADLIFGDDVEDKYARALHKIGIDPGMLSNEAGHA
ncbi:YqgE/AlgH family protein [Bradyrhizobium sp. UFLA05-112]